MAFSFKQKLAHYSAVAKGEKPTKKGSIFSKKEQQAYARGQRDAMNEQRRFFKFKNATDEERRQYKEKRKVEREAYKAQKTLAEKK